MICPFESKHDRTQHLSSMIREMTVISKVNRGPPIYSSRREHHLHIEGKAINLSKRASSSYRRESHQSFEERIINHLEVIDHPSFRRENHRHFEKTANPSFRRESYRHFEKIGNHHIERIGGNHFKTIVLSVINHPLI